MKTEHLQTKMVKMIIYFLFLPFCAVSLFVSYQYWQQMQKGIQKNLNTLFTRVNNNFTSALETLNYASASLVMGDFIIDIDKVDNPSESGYSQFMAKQSIQNALKDLPNSLLIQLEVSPSVIHNDLLFTHDDLQQVSFDHSSLCPDMFAISC